MSRRICIALPHGKREWVVEATPEGVARWMVRIYSLTAPVVARIRIGYLTGAKRSWVAEPFGAPVLVASSRKRILEQLGQWALSSPLLRSPS